MLDKKTMELLIDNRESIKERLESEKQDMNITFDNLSLGDYLFKLNGEDIIVIERKTIADLRRLHSGWTPQRAKGAPII